MSRSPRKKSRQSLPLPYEDLAAVSPALTKKAAPSESPMEDAPASATISDTAWNQLALWETALERSELRRPPEPPALDDAQLAPAPSPSLNSSDAAKPGGQAPASPPTTKTPSPAPRTNSEDGASANASARREKNLDDSSVEAAAEMLGLDMETLRISAEENEFRDFWRFLRQQAAARIQRLRSKRSADPFDWDGPALATVPAFVEDKKAVEILYRSLRGEEAPG